MFTLSARWFYICNAATDHTTCTLCYTMPSYFVTRCTCTTCILCYTLPLVQEAVGFYHAAPTGIARPVTLGSSKTKQEKSPLKISKLSLNLHFKEASRSLPPKSFSSSLRLVPCAGGSPATATTVYRCSSIVRHRLRFKVVIYSFVRRFRT